MKKGDWKKLIAALVVGHLPGIIGAPVTSRAVPVWYDALTQPPLSPPNWVFAPVWLTLYTLLGVSLFLVWRSRDTGSKRQAYAAFWVQWALNALWTPIFFGLRAPSAALVVLIALLVAIGWQVWVFRRHSRTAALLLVPYFLWCLFAAWLNAGICWLN